ncbi:24096_t:CDS:1, partial [Gigaspora rosea]
GYKHKLQRRTNDRFCDGTSSGDFNGKFYDGTNNNDSSTAKLYLEQKKER